MIWFRQLKDTMKKQSFSWLPVLALTVTLAHAGVTVVDGPDVARTNSFYVSNRAPLEASRFIGLPVGSVEPHGWLREFLERQREGLTGHLGEISAWLQKDDNAWLSKDGKGKYGWEELPYWLKGYIELAYIFNDPKMIAESNTWIEGALASQRPNGDFGPDQRFDDGSRDYWANMIMMFCLESYYEHTHDPRVVELMTKYFKYQLTVPDDQMLTHYWQKMRGGDNLYSIYWLYNRTGDPGLLKLADKIHRCTANWEMKDTLPNWHNVNIAECFREPARVLPANPRPRRSQGRVCELFRSAQTLRSGAGRDVWRRRELPRPAMTIHARPSRPAAWSSRCCPTRCCSRSAAIRFGRTIVRRWPSTLIPPP